VSPPLLLVDPPRDAWWPLASTRPVADLLAGTRTFRVRWGDRRGPVATLLCDPEVEACAFRPGPRPAVNVWPSTEAGWRIASPAWIPPPDWRFGDRPAVHLCAGEPVGWRIDAAAARRLAAGEPAAPAARAALAALDLPAVEAGGRRVASVWSLVHANGEILRDDEADFGGGPLDPGGRSVVLGGGVRSRGEVRVDPFVVLDAREGPILLDRGVQVGSQALLRGPLYVGPGTRILGGVVGEGSSFGPRCKLRGEVEASVFLGYANKAHEGFVGHSVVGEWANLGAGTTTSDLKNTYGAVRVTGPGGRVETGLLKAGSFLGDHVRTGIGALLTTGARLGTATHFFGGRGVSPDWLPAFTWFDGVRREPVRLEEFLGSARLAMARREQELEPGEEAILRALAACSSPTPDANFDV
jgi:UDP-N-acetylglucosamine diphosphorylase/glucosamine-1-phosphate N-acetyltransferase